MMNNQVVCMMNNQVVLTIGNSQTLKVQFAYFEQK